ncbi:MAG: ATP-binding protein [Thermodesulfobacteriota bacterium]
MEKLHSLLRRQIAKKFKSIDLVPDEVKGFLKLISDAYFEFDTDREMLERTIELSSKELLQANNKLRAIFQAIPDLFFLLDSEGVILESRTGSATDLFVLPEQLIGSSLYDVTPDSVSKQFKEAIQKIREGEQSVRIIYGLNVHDNESYYEARLLPAQDNKIIAIIRNITVAKRAEEELEKMALFAKKNPAPVLRLNAQGIVLLANDGAKELFKGQELIGMSWYHLCPVTPAGIVQKLIGGEESTIIEAEINSKYFIFNLISIPEYCFFDVYGTDITQRRQAEIALGENLTRLEKKTRFESIINSITKSVHQSIDLDNVLENAVEALRGNMDRVEYTGIYLVEGNNAVLKAYRGFPDWFVERTRRIPYPKGFTWKTILDGESRYCADTEKDEFLGPAGREVGTKSYISILLVIEEDVIGTININSLEKNAFDIEERVLLENVARQVSVAISNARNAEEKTKLINKLESALDQVKAIQEELVVKEKLASLGALIAGIAHEIKNPLNFVNNLSELTAELVEELRDEVKNGKENLGSEAYENLEDILNTIDENLKKINQHGKRADRVIHSMLQHSRGRAGERQETEINDLLDDAVNLAYHGMRAQDASFNTSIEKDYDNSAGKTFIVPQDISRVFLNVLSNAFYETHKKRSVMGDGFLPKLCVTTKGLSNEIEIRIRDNGNGIPEQILDKIYNPFFTTKPTGQGTGLGLSLSYDIIVHEHKGKIKVETREGEFTEFIIILPKDEDHKMGVKTILLD